MNTQGFGRMVGVILALAVPAASWAAAETVATAVYARVGNGYRRAKAGDGSFKPEYYALSNGGRMAGTTTDITVDRVAYPEVAEIAMRLLAQQNYRYAQREDEADLLLVLQWGNTIGFDRINYAQSVNQAASIHAEAMVNEAVPDPSRKERLESALIKLMMENRARDRINAHNARVIGYFDDLNESNDIRRWAGGGDRYRELIGDVEESRYYVVISAFDFGEIQKRGKKKLLWQARVSVRTSGNAFDDSVAAMLKSASKYFGQDSGRLVRSEETKGTVELGDLKFLGEAKNPEKSPTKEGK